MKLNQLLLKRSGQIILNDIEDSWPEQGVVVLLGANGAGKSTLLEVISGVKEADSGDVILSSEKKSFLMPEPASFYPYLSVREQLSFVDGLIEKEVKQKKIDEVMGVWQLTQVADKLTKHLSLGFRQRLSLAQLSLSESDILLLDEPMNGMDPEIMSVFKSQISSWKKTKLIIMATHIMHEAQLLADWVVVMYQGQIVRSEPYKNQKGFHEIYQEAIDDHYHFPAQALN